MNARHLLPVSLVLNLCLLVAAGWLAIREPTRTALSARPQPQPAPTASTPAPVPAPLQAQPAKAAQSFDWRLVESEDYKKYITNLRSIGCPEETIRDIISADVKKLFDARKRTLSSSTNKFEYWKAGNLFGGMKIGRAHV